MPNPDLLVKAETCPASPPLTCCWNATWQPLTKRGVERRFASAMARIMALFALHDAGGLAFVQRGKLELCGDYVADGVREITALKG